MEYKKEVDDLKTDKLKILNCGNYFTVVNLRGEEENHSHVKTFDTAELLVKVILRKQVPKSDYLRESARRVTLSERYKEKIRIKVAKDKDKQQYYNVGGGRR